MLNANPDIKRVFLIASPDASTRDLIERTLVQYIADAVTFTANDGAEALFKAENTPPMVAILDDSLLKISAYELTQLLMRFKERVAIIVIAPQAESDSLMDKVVTGQLQFLSSVKNQTLFLSHLNRALNWVSFNEKQIYQSKFLGKDEVLIKDGEEGNFVYILRRGRLRAFKTHDDTEVTLGYIEPGEFVGEMSYINGEVRSANVICMVESELIEIPKEHLDAVLFSKPAWSKALMKTLSRRLKKSNIEKTKAS